MMCRITQWWPAFRPVCCVFAALPDAAANDIEPACAACGFGADGGRSRARRTVGIDRTARRRGPAQQPAAARGARQIREGATLERTLDRRRTLLSLAGSGLFRSPRPCDPSG